MEKSTLAERQAMAQVFQQFDQDNSGTMDVSELSGALEHLGIYVEEDQLNELVQQVEVNDQNEIFLEGFANLISLLKGAARYQLVGSSLRTKSGEYLQKALSTTLLSSDAIWRFFFDFLVVAVAYTLSIIIILDSVIPVPSATLIIQSIATVVFFSDILVSACTYRDRDDFWYTVKYYATEWFAADVIATIPWGLVLPEPASLVMRHVNWVLKMLKAPSMWRNSDKSVMTEQYINYYFKVLPISALLALFGFMVHVFTVVFVEIKRSRGDPDFSYDQALYFVIYTLCTVGFGDPNVILDSTEQLYACLVLLGAIFCNGYIIATFVTILQRADIHQDRRGKLRETLAVLEHFSMPPALQDEVLQFQDHLLGHSLSSAYASVVEGLPQEMRNNIDVAVKLRMVDTAPFLASLHDLLRIAIAKELTNAVAKPEQNLFVQGEPCRNMVFISHGLVDMIHRGGVQHTKLRTGQFFGVSALLAREFEIKLPPQYFSDYDKKSQQKQDNSNNNNNTNEQVVEEGRHVDAIDEKQQQKQQNDTQNSSNNDNEPTCSRMVFAKHTVSAKAVSYCDLWTLRGATVIAMSKRFVQLKTLIIRLHEEFQINPGLFCCVPPPTPQEAHQYRLHQLQQQQQQQSDNNNNTKNGNNPPQFNASFHANSRRQKEQQQQQLQGEQNNNNNTTMTTNNSSSNNDNLSKTNSPATANLFGDLRQETTEIYDNATNNNNDDDQEEEEEEELAPKEDTPSIQSPASRLLLQNQQQQQQQQQQMMMMTNSFENPSQVNQEEKEEFERAETQEGGQQQQQQQQQHANNNNNNNNNDTTTSSSAFFILRPPYDADELFPPSVHENKEDPYHGFEFEDQDEYNNCLEKRRENNDDDDDDENNNNNKNGYIQTVDSLPSNVRVHSLTERLHICHARVRVLLGAVQQQQFSSNTHNSSVQPQHTQPSASSTQGEDE